MALPVMVKQWAQARASELMDLVLNRLCATVREANENAQMFRMDSLVELVREQMVRVIDQERRLQLEKNIQQVRIVCCTCMNVFLSMYI